MTLSLNGTTGVSGVDGSASAPAVTGTDSNTGINFGSDTVNINTGGTTRVTVDSAGSVGIGTSTPTSSFSNADDLVVGDGSGNRGITILAGTSGISGIEFSDGTGSDAAKTAGGIRYDHSGNYMRFNTNDGSERMRIRSDGQVLVGTSNSADTSGVGIKLKYSTDLAHITTTCNHHASNGSFYHLYNMNASNNGYRFYVQTNGGVYNYSGNNYNLSDEREKKNITVMGSVYNSFKQFVFKDFNYLDEDDSVTKKHGVIAQEVELIDSDLVSEGFKTSVDSEGNDVLRKGLKEEQFMMIGLKTLQETITKLEAAEAKIETLETKVAALEAG